jgi:hypothetical protein
MSALPIIDRIGGRKSSALDRCNAVRQQIVIVPISEARVVTGGASKAIQAEEADLWLAHRLAAGLTRRHLARFVIIYSIMPELFAAFRANITVVDFECGLYCLTTAGVVMDQRMLREMAGMAFCTDFACMQAR